MGKDCEATYAFQTFPNRSTLRLMLNISVKDDLTMQLISGPCWVNCSGVESDCDVTVTQHKWSPTQHSIDFFDMPPGNYCVKLFENDCEECCVVCTQTEELTASQREMSILLQSPMMQFFVIGCLLMICLLLLVFVIVFSMKRVSAHAKKMLPNDQSSKIDDSTDLSVDALKSLLKSHILLIYARDSPSFCKLIESFRRVLMRLENIEVHDYLEELQYQSSKSTMEWLTDYLQSPDSKIMIIISRGAVILQQALLKNKRVVQSDPHHLDSVFSFVLCYLHNDFLLSRNYKRIISVRFEDVANENETLNFITPLRCFVLMKHIDQLLLELRGVPASFDFCKNEFSAYHFPETQDLMNTLKEIKK